MSGTAFPQSSSDSFWPSSPHEGRIGTGGPAFSKHKKKDYLVKDFLSSVDETPDFHDPYSELNLFLSQCIKSEMKKWGENKKWSLKIQEELLEKISPQFQKKFPLYRLGVAALKKTWEKVAYFTQQLENQKEALKEDGSVNVDHFIKENLKQYRHLKNPFQLHPYHYAHQLAVKISECIAVMDGVRPKLEHLAKTIWSVQRHMLSFSVTQQLKSPYDEYDKIDKLIVKTILQLTAKEPHISQKQLEDQVKESLQSLHDLPSFASLDTMTANVSALLAEKLYPTSSFHTSFLSEQKKAMINFVRRQIALCKTSLPLPESHELVRRIQALYALANQMPKRLSEEEFKSAVLACYPYLKENRPHYSQSIYAFISAESVLMKNDQFCHSVDYVCDTIYQAYLEAKQLPELKEKEADLLEILIWKILSESDGLLGKLPYVIGQKIDEEIANSLIDNPQQSFASIVFSTVQFFRKTKELALHKKWPEIERKIHNWTIQGDLLMRFIRIDCDLPLHKLIVEKWQKMAHSPHHLQFISESSQTYLNKYPQLAAYAPQLMKRISILYKSCWYLHAKDMHNEETSLDRFLKWHISYLEQLSPPLSFEKFLGQLSEIVSKQLPLIPFDAESCRHLILSFSTASKQKIESECNEGQAQVLSHS